MTIRRALTPRRGAGPLLALLLAAAIAGPALAQDDAPEADDRGSGRPAPIDLTEPSQAAFRDWPPASLLERPYWLPWGVPAFQRAALFDRPVLFVLTVRWNRDALRAGTELLMDPDVLREINGEYISVLVNADRRPDILERYGTGAWPVIALLTAEGTPMLSQVNERKIAKPITIGHVDREAMLFLLREGGIYHRKWGNFLRGIGREWARREGEITLEAGSIDEAASDRLAQWMLANADATDGGFGPAPKLVVPGLSEYAWLRAARQVPALRPHAERTLRALVDGPLHDRRHGGVHRMAAAPGWGAIQYEKLLETNTAFLRELLSEARFAPGDEAYASAVDGTVAFLLRDLGRPGGGFYLAQAPDLESDDGGGWWRGETPLDHEPPVDRLVLSGANALAGAALIRAGVLEDRDDWIAAGERAIGVVLEEAHRPGSGVRHVVEPRPEERRFLETQADVSYALVDAFQSTGNGSYLAAARRIAEFAANNLTAPGETALRDHLPEATRIGLLDNPRWPIRPNARMARALVRLAALTGEEAYRDQAAAIVGSYAGDLARYGAQSTEAGAAVEELLREPLVLAVDGPVDDARTIALRRRALRLPWPWVVVRPGDAAAGPALTLVDGDLRRRMVDADEIAAFESELRAMLGAEPAS